MLRTFTATSVAALVAATFSAGAVAQDWDQERQFDDARTDRVDTDYSDKKVADVIKKEERFSKFRKALKEADMKDKLSEDSSYTVFAPTNDAFERLPEGTWEQWMDGENTDELRDLLSYHIVEKTITSDDLDEGEVTKNTVNDGELRISASYGSVTVNHINVAYADIEAENGVVHGIDSILFDTEQRTTRTSAL